jgi:hypothetical protein
MSSAIPVTCHIYQGGYCGPIAASGQPRRNADRFAALIAWPIFANQAPLGESDKPGSVV